MSVSVPAASVGTNNGWTDSGVTVTHCQKLQVVASGRWTWGPNSGNDAAADGDPGSGFSTPTPGIPVFGLITYLVHDGTTPVNLPTTGNPGPLSGVYAASANVANVCTTLYTAAQIAAGSPVGVAPWRVWYRIADTVLGDNSGSITVTTTTTADPATLPQTAPVPSGTWSLNPDDCTSTNVLSWAAIPLATGFRVYGAIRGLLGSTASPTYTDTSAQNDAYTVVPFNACGDGPTSAPLQLQPNANIPAVPTTVCQKCCQSIVVVTWTAVTATKDSSGSQDVVGYTLIRRGSDSSEVTLLEWSPSQAMLNNYQFRDDSVQLGITYTYDMVAFYGSNCQDSPDTFVPIKITGNTTPALPTCAIGTPTLPGNGWQTPGCRCDSLPVNSGKR